MMRLFWSEFFATLANPLTWLCALTVVTGLWAVVGL